MKSRIALTALLLLLVFSVGMLTESQPANAYLPERCHFPVPINCNDHVVTDEADHSDGVSKVPGIMLVLQNGGPKGIRIKSISARPEPSGLSGKANGKYNCSWVKPGSNDRGFLLKRGEEAKFSLTNSSEQEKEKGCPYIYYDSENTDWYSLELRYSWADSSIDHVITGQMDQYRYQSPTKVGSGVFLLLLQVFLWIIAVLLWLIVSIYLIAIGRVEKTGLIKKKIGRGLVTVLLALVAVGGILVAFGVSDLFLYFYSCVVAPSTALAALIAAVRYAARKKAKLPRIPLLMLAITFAIIEITAVITLLDFIT